jgi:chromosome segregation ATPase
MSNTGSDWSERIQDSLTEIKVSSANVESKIEQLVAGMHKLEVSLEDMKNITSNQETRIQLLEAHCSRIPNTMAEDFAVMKSQLSMYRNLGWMITSVVIGLVVKTFFDLMSLV